MTCAPENSWPYMKVIWGVKGGPPGKLAFATAMPQLLAKRLQLCVVAAAKHDRFSILLAAEGHHAIGFNVERRKANRIAYPLCRVDSLRGNALPAIDAVQGNVQHLSLPCRAGKFERFGKASARRKNRVRGFCVGSDGEKNIERRCSVTPTWRIGRSVRRRRISK